MHKELKGKYSTTTVKIDCFQRCVLENTDPVEEGLQVTERSAQSGLHMFKVLPADMKERDAMENRAVRELLEDG